MTARSWGIAVAAALAARLVFDLWVDVPTRVPGLNLAQAGTLLAMGIFAAAAAVGARRLDRRVVAAAGVWGVVLLVGWWRSVAPGADAVMLRYVSGPLVALAVAGTWQAEQRRVWAMCTVFAGALVVLPSVLGLGGSGWTQLHETWRFVGPYDNLHALALAMALIIGVAGTVAMDRQWPVASRIVSTVVAAGAGIALAASATRSGVLFVGVFAVTWALLSSRWRLAAVAVVAVVTGVAIVPGLRTRTTELVLALGGVAPAEGWEWLGTGRIAIWTRSWQAFSELTSTQQWFGTGLAGYETFWKGKEPHSEYLGLTYQLGVLGPLLFVGTGVVGMIAAIRRRAEVGVPAMGAVIIAVMVTSAVGSTLLVRMPLSWAFWAALGAVVARDYPREDRT